MNYRRVGTFLYVLILMLLLFRCIDLFPRLHLFNIGVSNFLTYMPLFIKVYLELFGICTSVDGYSLELNSSKLRQQYFEN